NNSSRPPSSPGDAPRGAGFIDVARRYATRPQARPGAGCARLPTSLRSRSARHFDDVPFQAVRGFNDLVLLALGHPERVERGADMPQRQVPFRVGDPQPVMRGFHVGAGVISRTAERRAKKVDQQLLAAPAAVDRLAL